MIFVSSGSPRTIRVPYSSGTGGEYPSNAVRSTIFQSFLPQRAVRSPYESATGGTYPGNAVRSQMFRSFLPLRIVRSPYDSTTGGTGTNTILMLWDDNEFAQWDNDDFIRYG